MIVFCRLDSLVGLFSAGCQPSSTNDPFGLRRISYGLVSTTYISCVKYLLKTSTISFYIDTPLPPSLPLLLKAENL